MHKIGDVVWYAQIKTIEKYITCPHCFGDKCLTVILGDESKVSIDCECCREGMYYRGQIQTWERIIDVCQYTIDRVEIKKDEVVYGLSCSYSVPATDVFLTREEAEVRATVLVEQKKNEEVQRLHNKEQYSRTWAWNATYHRNRIKLAEKDIVYHTAKLNVAKARAKELV